MIRRAPQLYLLLVLLLSTTFCVLRAQESPASIQVHWQKVLRVSQTIPTFLLLVGPPNFRGSPTHDRIFQLVKDLGAEDVRYTGGGYYLPHYGVAELAPPTATSTSWDFSYIEPMTEDVMDALKGHKIVLDTSSIPEWMFKNTPLHYPSDPNKTCWDCSSGRELRDPTAREVADYFARFASWHVKGGFTDELGKWHASGHHYKIDYWEVLNEPHLERDLSPEVYTKIYDAVVEAVHKISPETKFVGISDDYAGGHPEMFLYFLNPKNHKPGIPLDMISYHFYAMPGPRETPDDQAITYFYQADRFLETVGYIEAIRKMYTPRTGTMINEIGTMLPDDWDQSKPDYVFKPIQPSYWNLSAATYAYVFAGLASKGIEVAGESALPASPGLWVSITMEDWNTGQPNCRYWVLKMIHDNFHPGDKIVESESKAGTILTQGYVTRGGERKVLIVNKRDREINLAMPEAKGGTLEVVDQVTGSNPPGSNKIEGESFKLGGLAVAVVTLPR